ncbi:hypothetical protein D6T64_02165 [Cryobacterium melibiosiphilum]|uniref:Uncharacterized protein n=1 Tax=Cryobacterium melibiosiphilum TaxID=995039 RepID=A0A3A5MMJ1_9MICO|nr:hypothetical protein [Cryobacterium melibiosiphilum]RJT91320.1 hypothetical protein D6T64_02165 [Cryobacterium melibiosiphilum]
MPTFPDPVAAADAASESMRALAHATRRIDDPSQTYDVLGNLIATVRSLGQVLDQVASAAPSKMIWMQPPGTPGASPGTPWSRRRLLTIPEPAKTLRSG